MSGPVRVPLRVQWVDTDAGGRIHFTAAFRWAELAEHELLRSIGADVLTEFPRRHVEATFHRPLAFDDEFFLEIFTDTVGTSSVTYRWHAFRGEELCFDGATTAVLVGEGGRPARISDELRTALERAARAEKGRS